MSNNPNRQKTTLLFLRREDEILLAMKKRRFGEGKWNGVGGKVDEDESIEEAAIRECQEEVGVRALSLAHVADLHFFQEPETHPTMNSDCTVFLCHSWEGEPVETEEMLPKWFNVSRIPYDEMWTDDRLWLPRVIEGERIKGEFIFDQNDNFISHEVARLP